jgi:nitrile hydratase
MNGVHDMGGQQGMGPVEYEKDEPVFHAPWEGRVLAMHRAMGYVGLWNIDINRFTRETMPPQVYLASSYYKKWAISLEELCVKYGLVGADEHNGFGKFNLKKFRIELRMTQRIGHFR